jgi:zinc transport system permease protein
MLTEWLERLVVWIADLFPPSFWLNETFNVRALLAILLVSVICGAVGALVVGNRMSFFSDALAHCAFAGVGLGMLTALVVGRPDLEPWLIPLVMVLFGVAVGVAIAYVREKTGLASDTVIGVFFAFAVGFGAMLIQPLQNRRSFNVESFMFGSPLFIRASELLWMLVLALLTVTVLVRRYNQFVLASFNPSLARSRNVPLRWCNYLFIILLALIVNICLPAVGALLINTLLVVPAATAANLSRNLRQMFRYSILLSLAAGVGGLWFSNTVHPQIGQGPPLELGVGGSIVVFSVLAFFLTVAWRAWADGRPPLGGPSLATAGARPENASIPAEPPAGRPA